MHDDKKNYSNDWQRTILPSTSSVKEVIQALNEVSLRIVLIVNENGVLEGTVSDGDIRRGLLRGLTLSSSIDKVLQKNPLVVPVGISQELVLQLMTANKIQQIPVVDENYRPIGLYLWDEVIGPVERSNLMVIMTGGKGTRLRPQTESCPKGMLHVAGKPMLEHIIERAKLEHFNHFVLAVYYLGHMIEEYFGDGSRFGVRIDYLKENKPLGTAGALSLLNPLPEQPFVVTNCDVITDIRYGDLLDFHACHGAVGTMAVHMHEWQHPFGVVQMDGIKILGIQEKPITRNYINAGIYALKPSVLKELQKNEYCDMPKLLDYLQHQGESVIGYPIHEPWLDVGRKDDLAKANSQYELNSFGKDEQKKWQLNLKSSDVVSTT